MLSSGQKSVSQGHQLLLYIPEPILFYLLVNSILYKENQGFIGIEKHEKGCIGVFLQTLFSKAREIQDEKFLTVNNIQAIHSLCAVTAVPSDQLGKFANKESRFLILQASVSGLEEICRFAKEFPEIKPSIIDISTGVKYPITPMNIYTILNLKRRGGSSTDNRPVELGFEVTVSEELSKKLIENEIKKYKQAVNPTSNDNQILTAIVEFGYNFFHFHSFENANTRTTMLVMDLLLMQHGFPPIVYVDYDWHHLLSKQELFAAIKKSMLITLSCIQNPNTPCGNFSISELKKENIQAYEPLIQPVRKERQQLVSSCLSSPKVNLGQVQFRVKALEGHRKKFTLAIENGNLDFYNSMDFNANFEKPKSGYNYNSRGGFTGLSSRSEPSFFSSNFSSRSADVSKSFLSMSSRGQVTAMEIDNDIEEGDEKTFMQKAPLPKTFEAKEESINPNQDDAQIESGDEDNDDELLNDSDENEDLSYFKSQSTKNYNEYLASINSYLKAQYGTIDSYIQTTYKVYEEILSNYPLIHHITLIQMKYAWDLERKGNKNDIEQATMLAIKSLPYPEVQNASMKDSYGYTIADYLVAAGFPSGNDSFVMKEYPVATTPTVTTPTLTTPTLTTPTPATPIAGLFSPFSSSSLTSPTLFAKSGEIEVDTTEKDKDKRFPPGINKT